MRMGTPPLMGATWGAMPATAGGPSAAGAAPAVLAGARTARRMAVVPIIKARVERRTITMASVLAERPTAASGARPGTLVPWGASPAGDCPAGDCGRSLGWILTVAQAPGRRSPPGGGFAPLSDRGGRMVRGNRSGFFGALGGFALAVSVALGGTVAGGSPASAGTSLSVSVDVPPVYMGGQRGLPGS